MVRHCALGLDEALALGMDGPEVGPVDGSVGHRDLELTPDALSAAGGRSAIRTTRPDPVEPVVPYLARTRGLPIPSVGKPGAGVRWV